MSKFTRTIAALLAALTLCGSLSSCADSKNGDETAKETVGTPTGNEDETYVADNLPELNYNEREITIFGIKNHEDLIGDVSGNIVESTIHARNLLIESRLNVKLTSTIGDDYKSMDSLRNLLVSGEHSVDIISGMQWKSLMLAWDGLYIDLTEAEYIDYDMPWWDNAYMDELQWNEKRYALIGDISTDMLKCMSAFYVNKALFEDNFTPVSQLYTTVFNGEWTWDKMQTYISDVYRDLNGSNSPDDEDILGLRTHPISQTDLLAYTAGMRHSTRDEDGNIQLISDQSRNIEIAEAVHSLLYENKGCLTRSRKEAGQYDLPDLQAFADGNTLFCSKVMGSAEYFVNMADDYAIIPHPKLDMRQSDYITYIHDGAAVFSIPITAKAEDHDMLSAVLEAMASENYRRLSPAYYDVVLKSRYSSDPQSAQLIDGIRSRIAADFICTGNFVFGTEGQLGTIIQTLSSNQSTNYMSVYKSMSKIVERKLAEEVNNRD